MFTRWRGYGAVAFSQLWSQLTGPGRKRVLLSILGVAVAISLLVVVTAVGVGLATSTSVYDDDVDYWIVPETDGGSSPLIATDGPAFGGAHDTAAELDSHPDIEYVSPVKTEVVRIEHGDRSEYVLVIGVISSPGIGEIAGLDAELLSPNDPYYTRDEWTGEVVLSDSAGSLLEAEESDTLRLAGNENFTVVGVDSASGAPTFPIALVQLHELQVLTGSDEYDLADQFVVGTNSPSVKSDLETVYPQSAVLSRTELTARETMDSDLPLALALTGFVVAVAIGTLFVTTTMGLELVADRRRVTTLNALGISLTSQLRLVAIWALSTTTAGGLLGGIAGFAATLGVNELALRFLTSGPIALVHPGFVVYGLVASVVIGVLTLPFLLLVTNRLARGVP